MFSTTEALLLLLTSLPTVSPASFPLTAITEYSSLAPCAQSHVSVDLSMWDYDGCSVAPISAYGSCICAQRLSSLQHFISVDFEFDQECSSTGVQPFITAFCTYYGVDLAEKEKGAATAAGASATATATATAGGSQSTGVTGLPTPGSTGAVGQPSSTATPSGGSSHGSSSGGGGGLSDNKITIIATIVGSVAGVIAVVIAVLAYRRMKR